MEEAGGKMNSEVRSARPVQSGSRQEATTETWRIASVFLLVYPEHSVARDRETFFCKGPLGSDNTIHCLL